jgi:Methyltransferase domain
MKWWRRKAEQESNPDPAQAVLPPPAGLPSPLLPPTPKELYDALLASLGFDSQSPGWSPALRDLHRHSRAKRLQVFPDFFYAPVFSPADLPESVWSGTFSDCGTFDLEAQKAFLRETPSFAAELARLPNERPADGDGQFYWANEQFGHSDASLYYSIIRRFRPRRIVEVGAGHSTKLALKAIRDNGTGGVLCIDPNAPAWLRELDGPIEIVPRPVQESPDSVFLGLEPSDILFIDGSHIAKTGSDVNHLFLRILPRLPKGVLVHVHDICLPFEYPRYWSQEVYCYWNEQYVLAALLANSTKFEILLGIHFLQKIDTESLRHYVPQVPGVKPGGGSLWMRVRA